MKKNKKGKNLLLDQCDVKKSLPSDEEIKKEFERREKLNRDAMTGLSPTFEEGAKWARDYKGNEWDKLRHIGLGKKANGRIEL